MLTWYYDGYGGYGGYGGYKDHDGIITEQFRCISGTGCSNSGLTPQILGTIKDAITIVECDLVIIMIGYDMYVFPIKTIDNNVFVKYTTLSTFLTSAILPHGLYITCGDDDVHPTLESLHLLYDITQKILNDTFYDMYLCVL